jgi:ATP-dependent helicase/nuclease subunit B
LSLISLLDQGVTVLTASRRLAHAIRMEYAARVRGQALHAWRTPHVIPLSAWFHREWIDHRAASGSTTRLLSRAQSRLLWDQVVNDSSAAGDLLNPSEAARNAARSWELVHDYLIPIAEVADANTAEGAAFYSWAHAFTRRCRELDCLDEARLSAWAFESGLVPGERVVLAGFDAPTPALRRLTQLWMQSGRLCETDAGMPAVPDVCVVSAHDAQAEMLLAARWARAQLEAGRSNIGVVVTDLPAHARIIERTFLDVFTPRERTLDRARDAIPIVLAAPQPLSTYPLVDAALACLQLSVGAAPSTLAGRLLRSPFLAGSEAEQDSRALADARLRSEQRDRWDWFELERWAGVTRCGILELIARAVGTLVRQGWASASPATWSERFDALLRLTGWPGERTLSSSEHQTLLKFHEALAQFGALTLVAASMPPREALGRLREVLTDTLFQPESDGASVTVIDVDTVAGMQFEALWVTGGDAGRWPPPPRPDPLLPLELQRRAGIPESSASAALERAQVRMSRLAVSAPSVVFSWPRRDGDVELARSPLLDGWPVRESETLPLVTTRSMRRTLFDARPPLMTLRDDRAPRVESGASPGGATVLELQSRCPFRALAQVRWRAEPLARVSLGIEPRERGTLLHRVLAAVWAELKTQHALLAVDPARLEREVHAITQRVATLTLQGTSRHRRRLAALEVDGAVRQVLQLLAIERQRAPFSVRFAEQVETFTLGGLAIRLQPDRVDELASGGQLLIDYKLGDSHQPSQWLDAAPGRPRRPQLPVYALAHRAALSALAFAVLAPGTVEYRGWSRTTGVAPGIQEYPGRRPRPGSPPDWATLIGHWEATLTQLAQQYIAGAAGVDPLPRECDTCHLSVLCRINDRVLVEDDEDASA